MIRVKLVLYGLLRISLEMKYLRLNDEREWIIIENVRVLYVVCFL